MKEVLFKQAYPDVSPATLNELVAGTISKGVFIPKGSVSVHFFELQRLADSSKKEPQDVYFIQAGENGAVKIGIAKDVFKRLEMLQTGNENLLSIVKVIKGGGFEKESMLHKKHKEFHIRGEWYKNQVLTF